MLSIVIDLNLKRFLNMKLSTNSQTFYEYHYPTISLPRYHLFLAVTQWVEAFSVTQ